MPGEVFHLLTVVREAAPVYVSKVRIRRVHVRCACGSECVARVRDLLRGDTKSCSCYKSALLMRPEIKALAVEARRRA